MLTASPTVLLFAIGIGSALFLFYGLIAWNTILTEDQCAHVSNTKEGYASLAKKAQDSWTQVSKRHRLYLGALIIGLGLQNFGQITDHPFFGNPTVISFIYLLLFSSVFQSLVKARTLDQQVIASSMKGLQMEQEHPEWRVDFFSRFVKENYRGFGLFSLVFFRMGILSWLLFSAINFGIIFRFEDRWSALGIATVSVAVFMITALVLWRVGCRPYYLLSTRAKEVIA